VEQEQLVACEKFNLASNVSKGVFIFVANYKLFLRSGITVEE